MTEIVDERLDGRGAARRYEMPIVEPTHLAAHATDVAEAAQGFRASVVARHAARDERLDGGLDVIAQLIVEIGGGVGACEPEIAAPLGLARFAHVASGTASRELASSTRPTAATRRSHPSVRWRSMRRPSGVRR